MGEIESLDLIHYIGESMKTYEIVDGVEKLDAALDASVKPRSSFQPTHRNRLTVYF